MRLDCGMIGALLTASPDLDAFLCWLFFQIVIQQGAEVDVAMYIIVTGTVGIYVGDQTEAGKLASSCNPVTPLHAITPSQACRCIYLKLSC